MERRRPHLDLVPMEEQRRPRGSRPDRRRRSHLLVRSVQADQGDDRGGSRFPGEGDVSGDSGRRAVTVRVGNTVVISPERPADCEVCGTRAELRPYGPNGEHICFDCGMKDETTTKARMNKMLFGEIDS